ncbi:hypothetical protein [Saccharopolyspora sp. NPDC049426]|uniref:ATP-binding protein n=1 Tax=Saccharopolyspora sp. NPDC049426 TaxID=3155652 RepID=UPI0034310961
MNAMTLLHLTFVGPGKQSAVVEFGRKLTVIYGASDTGKSYIVEAIDYMLGASKLKDIPEASGYSHVLLGMRLPSNQTVTLCRSLSGKQVDLYEGDVRSLDVERPTKTLPVKHSAKSENLSRYLLSCVGADQRNLLKNQRGETLSLSFRYFAALSVVNETRMASQTSPVLTSGQKTSATAERSAFRYMLTGDDDSGRVSRTSDLEKRVSKGKLDLLDQVIADSGDSLTSSESESELRARLERLDAAQASISVVASDLVDRRSIRLQRIRLLEEDAAENRGRAGEVQVLVSRFDLLHDQYESDLARLEMVSEAGNLLGYFRTGTCAFCGAAPEYQDASHRINENTRLQYSVSVEKRKTGELKHDLLLTIGDLRGELSILEEEHASLQEELSSVRREVAEIDELLEPVNTDMDEVQASRAQIHSDLAVYAQIRRLKELRHGLSNISELESRVRPDEIPTADIVEFESAIQGVLRSWNVPGASRINYNQNTAEITVDGRPRSSRGKGMRSVIHAAFSTALAQYSAVRGLPHPGFVVLDSPILTYREPHENDIEIPANVVENFYDRLLSDNPCQVIVVENGNPPANLGDATVYAFSADGSDRTGFFPV